MDTSIEKLVQAIVRRARVSHWIRVELVNDHDLEAVISALEERGCTVKRGAFGNQLTIKCLKDC